MTAANEMKNLTKNYVIFFWGGSNDVCKNNSRTKLKHILNYVKNISHTNIILMCVPHRFDLIDSSCVNKQVCSINRKLEKLVKNCNYISVIKIDLSREYF